MSKRQAHISKEGSRFRTALEAAERHVRANSKFTGLPKVRAAIAFQAALKATGFPQPAFEPPKAAGPQTAAEAEFKDATEAARMAIGMSPAAVRGMA
jgi:hypothetical protein